MTQPIIPGIDTSARDSAIETVESACPVATLYLLRDAAREVARHMERFTTDDITKAAPMTPREPRVLGAVMVWARKQGFCRATGIYQQSSDPRCHNRPKMIWESRIYRA